MTATPIPTDAQVFLGICLTCSTISFSFWAALHFFDWIYEKKLGLKKCDNLETFSAFLVCSAVAVGELWLFESVVLKHHYIF